MNESNDLVFERFVKDIEASLLVVEELEHILEDMYSIKLRKARQNPNSTPTQILSKLQAA